MENLCFCRQAVTLELWMKQTQNLKGFLKLPGMVKQSKSTKGYRVVLLNSHKNYGNGLKLNFFDSKFREIDLKMTKNYPKCPKITRMTKNTQNNPKSPKMTKTTQNDSKMTSNSTSST